jgi:Family of unknown function (DUF5989)
VAQLGGITMLTLTRELIGYLSARKKWWLAPVIVALLGLAGLLIAVQGTAVAPFIYTVF